MISSVAKNAIGVTGENPVLARLGSLEVRLAESPLERHAAAGLRHAVFCSEAGLASRPSGIETDRFDPFCDHLIVRDLAASPIGETDRIVGTSRLLRPAATPIGFYSQAEFDIGPLFARHSTLHFCEVGRSCIAPGHRSQPVIEALWRGLYVYAARHGIDVYFGAASFPGTDPEDHAIALSWLYHNAAVHKDWAVHARQDGAVAINRMPAEIIDRATALRHMPPLLRGYLKIGAHVSQTAFVDTHFGTTDVLVIAPLAAAPPFWRRRFETVTGLGLEHCAETVPIAPDLL